MPTTPKTIHQTRMAAGNNNAAPRPTNIHMDGFRMHNPATGKFVGTNGHHFAAATTDIIRTGAR